MSQCSRHRMCSRRSVAQGEPMLSKIGRVATREGYRYGLGREGDKILDQTHVTPDSRPPAAPFEIAIRLH